MTLESPKHCLTVDPEDEWKTGIIGFFHRWRGLVTAAAGKILTVGLVQYLFKNYWITGSAIVVAATCWGLLLLHRRHLMWCYDDKITLHDFCHWLRDQAAAYPSKGEDVTSWMKSFSENACRHTAAHFRKVLRDETVTCAIRLAKKVNDKQCFCTFGRSDGMDPGRDLKSRDLASDKGIARVLMNKDQQGIWLIPCIQSAANVQMWEKTENDDLLDVRHLMVAPINAYESGVRSMLGILYICSKSRRMEPLDTVEVRAWADLLGLAYSTAQARIPQQVDSVQVVAAQEVEDVSNAAKTNTSRGRKSAKS